MKRLEAAYEAEKAKYWAAKRTKEAAKQAD